MALGQQELGKRAFGKAPAGYVPGLGRGATGFTTRSDIGNMAKARPALGEGPASQAAQQDREKRENVPDAQFDQAMGNDGGLLGVSGDYDDEDREADEIWEAVDARMAERRRERREKRLKEEIEKYRADNPKITEQFADLKRKLGALDDADWEAIPEIGDYTIGRKKQMQYTPVPDTLLAQAAAEKETAGSVVGSGLETPAGGATDLTAVGAGRGTMLGLKLDRASDSVSGQTVVDPKGYLTDLKSMKMSSTADIQDIKKARKLLQSVIQTNPGHAPGWVAAARLEADLGKASTARAIIAQGCKACPGNEEIWLHAAHLQGTPANAKATITLGLEKNPKSVKLWMEAVRLEEDAVAQQRILRRGLEKIPESVKLWRGLVDLATPEDARILLQRAVECCPQHVDLWLALAKLEDYKGARGVLNRARQTIPTEPLIWITAAKLEEAHENLPMVPKIVDRALKSFRNQRIGVSREVWLKHAQDCEKADPPAVATCQAIVAAAVGEGVDEEDRIPTWKADAEDRAQGGFVETARAILAHALALFPGDVDLWMQAARLEQAHGSEGSLDALLARAVAQCPTAEELWLMGAKEKWLRGNLAAARDILGKAFAANPDSEDIQLAAFKLEFSSGEFERSRILLRRAREGAGSERVWHKAAQVERQLGDTAAELEVLRAGLAKFPTCWKMWLMQGQREEALADTAAAAGDATAAAARIAEARATYTGALQRCPQCVPLWLGFAALEERQGALGRARALLEQGRTRCPGAARLWLAAVHAERRAGQEKAAEALMAKALQECPADGALWAEFVALAPRPQRKRRSVDALKKCNNDPFVVAAVAQLFWAEGKPDKARAWFERAVALTPKNGDGWAQYYRFEAAQGTPEQQERLAQRCAEAEPNAGLRWPTFAKAVANAFAAPGSVLKQVAADFERHPVFTPWQAEIGEPGAA